MAEHHHELSHNREGSVTALSSALLITIIIMVVELAGGIFSGSLALLSDAGHMVTDIGALLLAIFALFFSRRPATGEKTFGFYRLEILSALLNGAFLILIAGFIFFEAIKRSFHPEPVNGAVMLSIAVIGLLANLVSARILSSGSKDNLNVRAALWHVLSDAFSSVGVILAGLIIALTGIVSADLAISVVIAVVILIGAWRLLSESIDILLEATPRGIDINKVVEAVKGVKGVKEVHDLHIWTITSGFLALSAHIVIDDALLSACADISKDIKAVLHGTFRIDHATLEFECKACQAAIVCPIER